MKLSEINLTNLLSVKEKFRWFKINLITAIITLVILFIISKYQNEHLEEKLDLKLQTEITNIKSRIINNAQLSLYQLDIEAVKEIMNTEIKTRFAERITIEDRKLNLFIGIRKDNENFIFYDKKIPRGNLFLTLEDIYYQQEKIATLSIYYNNDFVKSGLSESNTGRVKWIILTGLGIMLILNVISVTSLAIVETFDERRRQLLLSEKQLRTVVDLIPSMVYAKDREGRFLLANNSIASLYKTDSENLIGKKMSEFHHEKTELDKYYLDDLKIINGEAKQITTQETFKDHQGNSIYLKTFKVPFPILGHEEQAALGISIDITELIDKENELLNHRNNLELLIKKRTQDLEETNKNLIESMEKLKSAQQQLVQSEKMASLGCLVAGFAHEVNTPVGIGVSLASHLEEKTRNIHASYQKQEMTRSDLENYFQTSEKSTDMILMNLQRAAELINSFKMVAVDQSSEDKRKFKFKEYLEKILKSLNNKLKNTDIQITVSGSKNLELNSYPGVFSQLITNFVMNSLLHAFDRKTKNKQIKIGFTEKDNQILLEYSDNGAGIEKEHLNNIFDPFFTTKRGQEGSGLGLNIVYNLVTGNLKGKIKCESQINQGTLFSISFPK